jgi:Zn-dependent protease
MAELLRGLSVIILPLIFAVTLHETAHAWVADKKGDATARMLGRISLNPWVHIDLFGTILVPLMLFFLTQGNSVFGWAKPVPVNTRNLYRPKQDMAWVAAAGPGMNLLLALASGVLHRLLSSASLSFLHDFFWAQWILPPLLIMLRFSIHFNLLLMVFNLIPIPPLDGGRVLAGLLPTGASHALLRLEPYGMFLLIFLFYIDPFGLMPRIVGPTISFFSTFIFGR